MPIALYDATVASFAQSLGALVGLLDKAKAHCDAAGVAEAELIGRRLAPDMLPFGYQVKSAAVHSWGAILGVRAGRFSPDTTAWPETLAGLRERITDAIAALEAIDPAEVEGFTGRDMTFVAGDRRMDFSAENFLLSFSMPNFYFHVTAAYALLRAEGLAIGKRDFIGLPRLKA